MKTLCSNFDREEYALETVLELPIPQEMFATSNNSSNYKQYNKKSWQTVRSWLSRPINVERVVFGDRGAEIQFLLGVIGAPLIPLPIPGDHHWTLKDSIKGHPIETSMAKYIVQQYIAAAGGEHALNSISSMYAMGKVKMAASDVLSGDEEYLMSLKSTINKATKPKNSKQYVNGEIGGFVLWQKRPDLWSLELMVSGCKMSAGSDGKVAWRQTPWHHSHASRCPPRPLRRSLQGLDPRSIANLFSNSICTGEKTINDEDCFVLKLEAEPSTLKARSSSSIDIIKHTFWGYFSQKTGLLVQLEDTHLLRIKAHGNDVFWETTMDSKIEDYRTIDGVNIAHGGSTLVSLHRFGQNAESDTIRTRMEEAWSIEEVDFNIKGLSTDCFLPPSDLNKTGEEGGLIGDGDIVGKKGIRCKVLEANYSGRISSTAKGGVKVMAIDEENLKMFETDGEEL